uniref:rotatin-like n=1 Tax=Styela clava TaxID=7725 RepID=UPI001939E68F|nr:rotatin-like [Styela clava]
MSSQANAPQGLDLLFQKLGHNLVEIRTRALSSILSKLEHGVIHDADLVQERQLFIRLLEWFNFNQSPMRDEVFKLILRLSNYTSACELMVSLGAVMFFTDLRKDLSGPIKTQLDSVLDRLFHVTDAIMSDSRCTYQRIEEDKMFSETPAIVEDTSSHVGSGYFQDDGSDTVQAAPAPAMNYPGDEDKYPFITFSGFPWHFLTATDRHVLSSTSTSLCSSNVSLVQNACSFLLDVVFRDFPAEIFLQRPTILVTLLTLLKSRPSAVLMSTTCDCLSFIARNLVSRILYYEDPDLYCPRQGLPLRRGAMFDSSNIAQNGHTGGRSEAEGERQERRGGDGRDENSLSSLSSAFSNSIQDLQRNDPTFANKDDESLEDDHTITLQLAQISTQQFCISTFQSVLPLLLIEDASLFFKLYEVAMHCVNVLEQILDADCFWSSNDDSTKSMKTEIESLCESIGRAVLHHYHLHSKQHLYTNSATAQPEISGDITEEWTLKFESNHESVYHRVAFHACSSLALKFLKIVVPVEKSNLCIKDVMVTALYVIACDEPLRSSYREICTVAETYLEQCDEEKNKVLRDIQQVVQSIYHMHQFLDECKSEDKDLKLQLELAENALICLPYYSVKGFIPFIAELIAEICNSESKNGFNETTRKILLQLLAHPVTRIRSNMYESCLHIVKSNLNVTIAAENPTGSINYICNFLMSTSVLYEIMLHGVSDSSALVSTPAQDLVLHLLQSKLLMKDDLWISFKTALNPVMPVLQAFTGETELLRDAVFDFISTNYNFHDKLKCLLRCLFIKQRAVRSIAGGILSKALVSHERSLSSDEKFKEQSRLLQLLQRSSNIVGLTDLLVSDKPIPLTFASTTRLLNTGLFHEDSVVRMLSIFRSRSVDWPVRRSALQQLSVVLTNRDVHDIFLKSDGLVTIKSHLLELVTDNSILTEVEKSEADACVSILKSISRWNPDVRHALSNETTTILALLRMTDLCRLSSVSVSQVASLITLLLFHDVIKKHECDNKETSEDISLPAGVMSYYQIPFLCPTHHVISVHRTLTSPPKHCDPLLTGPAAFSIRIATILAQNDKDVTSAVKSLLDRTSQFVDDKLKPGERNQLAKAQVDMVSLTYSDANTALNATVSSISNATSHVAVHHAVSLMRILLKSCPLSFSSIMFANNNWRNALDRFLCVLPSSVKDEKLLLEIISLMDDLLNCEETMNFDGDRFSKEYKKIEETLLWYLKMNVPDEQQQSVSTEMPLLSLLKSSEPQSQQSLDGISSVTVRRQLCKAILSMLSRISRKTFLISNKKLFRTFQAALCHILLIRLKLADAPQFYDLPSMEVTLECLVHNTAFSGWTTADVLQWYPNQRHVSLPRDGTILCRQLISTLLEVVSAFHIESRGSSMSYMGKGVSRSATQSIVHLVYEMAHVIQKSDPNSQVHEWLNLSNLGSADDMAANQVGIHKAAYDWMLPLWSARDPRIRFSGLALAVALSSSVQGCLLLEKSFQKYPGGIWSTSFAILFDDTECSVIRSQAATLISNMISHDFESGSVSEDIWRGPVVMDEERLVSSSGIPALITMLHQLKFSRHIITTLSRYHSSYSIQPVTIFYSPFDSSTTYSTSTKNSVISAPESVTGLENSSVHQHTQSPRSNTDVHNLPTNARNISTDRRFGISPISAFNVDLDGVSMESYASAFPSEWLSVCTPKLVANICSLLENLINLSPHEMAFILKQDGVMESIGNLVDVPVLISYLQECESVRQSQSTISQRLKITTRSIIAQYTESFRVLHSYVACDKGIAYSILKDTELPTNALHLINIPVTFEHIWQLQESAMNFLSCIIQQNISRATDIVRNILVVEWTSLSKSVRNILSERQHESLILATVTMLGNILNCISSSRNQNKLSLFDIFDREDAEDEIPAITSILIEIFETYSLKSEVKSIKMMSGCAVALQTLFLVSPIARITACEVGFLQSLMEEIKHLHAKIEMCTTGSTSGIGLKLISKVSISAHSQENEQFMKKIIIHLHILCDLMCGNEKIKNSACESSMGLLVSKIWNWTPVYNKLKTSVLKLLLCYTAGCEKACTSLSTSSIGLQPLLNHIISEAQEFNSKILKGKKVQTSHFQSTFHLIFNISISQECRSLLWKSGFLNDFLPAADRGQHPKRTKLQGSALIFWLKLMHSVSFHTDGQLNILKIPDIIEVLDGITSLSKIHTQIVMNILRNLCFHNPSKARISSNKTAVKMLLNHLSSKSHQQTTLSALWALLSNSQKSKVHLKVAGLTSKAQNALISLNQNMEQQKDNEARSSLMAILEIMNI